MYADILKAQRGLKRFEKVLEKKRKEFEELSKTYGLYEKMDAVKTWAKPYDTWKKEKIIERQDNT